MKTHLHTSESEHPQPGQESAALLLNSSHSGEAWKQFAGIFWPRVGFEAHRSTQMAFVLIIVNLSLCCCGSLLFLLSVDLICLAHSFTVSVYSMLD